MSTLGVIVFKTRDMKHLTQSLQSINWVDAVTLMPFDEEEGDSLGKILGKSFSNTNTDWILYLWGEETVNSELAAELRKICHNELSTAPLQYTIHVRTRMLNHWIDGSAWGPTPAPRLVRRMNNFSFGWWNRVSIQNFKSIESLEGSIQDYSCEKLCDGMDRLNDISSLWAKIMYCEGERISPIASIYRSFKVFIKIYLFKKLIFRGLAGLSISILAFSMALVSGMKLSEMYRENL